MRGLHVRALHNTWGVALGFEVSLSPNRDAVQVGPGIAYDYTGREIVLSRTLVVELPLAPTGSTAAAWWFDLIIRYNTMEGFVSQRQSAGGCLEDGRHVLEERPAWRWSFAGEAANPSTVPGELGRDVRLGEDVPLARFRIMATGQISEPDLSVRRNAQPMVRPHIASALVPQGSLPIEGSLWSWSAYIDTSSGGFTTATPSYFVRLADHPLLSPTSGFVQRIPGLPQQRLQQASGPFIALRAPTRSGFTVEVRSAMSNVDGFQALSAATALQKGLTLPVALHWVGMEPVGGCPPPPRSLLMYWFGAIFPQHIVPHFAISRMHG
jgi:hypothetical protein